MMWQLLFILITFFGMEAAAWSLHKYVMHGFGWFLHKDHHRVEPGFFEKNDLYLLVFAIPSWLLIMGGQRMQIDWMWSIGIGIALYGAAYFLVHDIFIHQRFNLFKRTDNAYLRAIRKAHKIHHKHLEKQDGECFGMLIVPIKYFREAKKAR